MASPLVPLARSAACTRRSWSATGVAMQAALNASTSMLPILIVESAGPGAPGSGMPTERDGTPGLRHGSARSVSRLQSLVQGFHVHRAQGRRLVQTRDPVTTISS